MTTMKNQENDKIMGPLNRPNPNIMFAKINTETKEIAQKGDIPGCGEIWYNPTTISNISWCLKRSNEALM